ncbi:Spy0128 family protein [Blautia sp. HCP3S3_C4]|uniref:Spy0128 family protein n=1 Tax=Blautia sp. HCP3S3_C4 TaxID=3438911 RepID=UPI003F8A28E1
MKKLLLREAAKHKLQNRRRKRWQKTVSILACLVVFCTVYALILPALTAEADTYCGKEEHTHTEDCYEDKLICGKEEGQGAHQHTDDCYKEVDALVCQTPESEGHQHTEACYTEEQVLTCTNKEEGHVHSEFDGCYTTEKRLTCGMEEGEGAHHHTAECYEKKKELICGQQENDGHRHTAECYKKELICGKEEHTHTLACYSNPDADVENGDVWQNTVSSVTLTGNWGADLAAIAQTQTGYTESTANYAVAEDGQTIHGYTRYGAWANDPYRDNWSAQFADFCLSYAGVPTSAVPQNSDCSAWNYTNPDGYTPKTGDLLLLDTDNNGSADHAGIVTTADDSTLTAIVGDADKAVRNNTYNIGSENIKGYVSIPENPALADDNNEEETTETTPAPEVTEEPQETPAPEITPEAEPTQEPETTPEAEPTQVPEATPKTEPTQALETTPEAELTPTPELSVTPTPIVDPELSVTPTPELSVTPTPELSVTPTVAPEPDYQYEDDKVIVVAYADEDANLPEDAVLNARYIEPGSEEYQNAVAAFDEQLGNDEDAVTDYVLYDVYFTSESAESENKEIEPEGNVNIFMTFKDNEHTKVQGDIVDTQVVHLKDSGEAEVIENGTVDVADDSTIQAITFTNSNFSITGARLLLAKAVGPTLEKNEWFGTLDDARSKRLVLQYDNQSLGDLQNAQSDIWVTCYNNQQQEIGEIRSFNIRSNVSQFNGQTLQNQLNNALNNISFKDQVTFVKLRWEIPSLSNTFFDFSDEGSVTLENGIKFNVVERTFQPDDVWTNGTLTYVAIGPQHQYNTSGPLGLASNFHIVGFSSVNNTAHTNGNIVTNSLSYGSNFGTSKISGEISYIKSFASGNNLQCGDGEDDILVIGKDMKVTVRSDRFVLIGSQGEQREVIKPRIIYQDTAAYSFLSLDTMKTQLESYNEDFAEKTDSGVEGLGGVEHNELTVGGTTGEAVWNVNASTLKNLKDNKLIIKGLSNNTGTSLIINVTPDTEVAIPEIDYSNNMSASGGEVTTFSAGKVIWNIKPGYSGNVTICGSKSSGTLIAPCATVTLNKNWNGSAFADVVNVTAESHRTDFTGSLGFGVTKTIDGIDNVAGKSWQSGYEFQFVLTGKTENGKKAPMPVGSDIATNSKTIAVTYANRTPSFGKIDYRNNDIGQTYTYTLVEKPGTIAGITYSQEEYEIQVKVSESGNGLSIENSYRKKTATGYTGWESGLPADGKFAFINKYEENKAHAVVKAQKMVNEQAPANNECFDFTLAKYDSDSSQWQTVETVQNSGRNVTFSQLNYDTAGIYYYKITETGQKSGYIYDTAVYVVKVEVEQTNNKMNTKSISYYKYEANDTIDLGSLGSSILENRVIFNNHKEDNYVLPETGGTGTNRFTAVGLALMAGSLMCGYVMRRKRREGRRN